MKHSVANVETTSLAALTRSPAYGARVIDILPVIGDADSTESVVALFRAAVAGLGADVALDAALVRVGALDMRQMLALAALARLLGQLRRHQRPFATAVAHAGQQTARCSLAEFAQARIDRQRRRIQP